MNLNERRRFPRIAPLLANEKRCLVSIGNRYLKSALVDMSGGGALLYLGSSDPAELGVGRLAINDAAERQQGGAAACGLPPKGVLAHVVLHL